jgi:SAM-dependent methyltransferase
MPAAEYDAWAEFYDLLNTGLPGEAEFYVGQAVRLGGETLELGCGTGRLAIPMAMSGVNVTGLDLSKAMLDRCRAKRRAVGPVPGKLRLVQGDMRSFDLGRKFSFVAAAYRTIMHLLTPPDQRRCLECVWRHLEDDGVFIFNCWNPRPSLLAPLMGPQSGLLRFVGDVPVGRTRQTLRHFCATSCDEFRQLVVEEHVVHVVDARGKVSRTEMLSMERAWLTARETENLVRLCGFEVEALFGDFDCHRFNPNSTEMIWILRKAQQERT